MALIAMLVVLGMGFAVGTYLHTAHARPPGPVHGSPWGYACIYPQDKGVNTNHPEHKYYHYGVYQLHNEYGNHSVVNNQYNGAIVRFCTDWNGKVCPWILSFGAKTYNFTPINSIVLAKG